MTVGRTGDTLEGTFVVPSYPDPSLQDVNTQPFGYAYGEGNYQFDITPPGVPGSVVSPSHTASTIVLTWTAATDNIAVDHYNVYLGGVLSGSTKNLTATVSGLVGATPYNLKVSAVDKHGNESALSSNVAVTTS